MFLTDAQILERRGMIVPMMDHGSKTHPITGNRIPSYGLSSIGYDLSGKADDFNVLLPYGVNGHVFSNGSLHIPDVEYATLVPLTFDGPRNLIPANGWLPAFSTVIAPSLESFMMPRDVFGIGALKSTWMRLGIHCECSPLEPGWEGIPSIVLTNPGRFPIKLSDGGYVQILFYQIEGTLLKAYNERDSASYQGNKAQQAVMGV